MEIYRGTLRLAITVKFQKKTTLFDTAKRLCHSRFVAAENRVISLSSDGTTFHSNNSAEVSELTVGWALPVTHPPVRFTAKQKKFLDVSSI